MFRNYPTVEQPQRVDSFCVVHEELKTLKGLMK